MTYVAKMVMGKGVLVPAEFCDGVLVGGVVFGGEGHALVGGAEVAAVFAKQINRIFDGFADELRRAVHQKARRDAAL